MQSFKTPRTQYVFLPNHLYKWLNTDQVKNIVSQYLSGHTISPWLLFCCISEMTQYELPLAYNQQGDSGSYSLNYFFPKVLGISQTDVMRSFKLVMPGTKPAMFLHANCALPHWKGAFFMYDTHPQKTVFSSDLLTLKGKSFMCYDSHLLENKSIYWRSLSWDATTFKMSI